MGLDIAIDLGTSVTRIYIPGKGIVVSEPSVIAIDRQSKNVLAVGQEAYRMLGRTSKKYDVIYPLTSGVISELHPVESLIAILLRRVVSSKISMPRAVVCVPGEITDVEKRAVVNAISSCGIRRVCLVEESIAAAIGAGIDTDHPHGSFVIDIGGGTTDMAVITLGGVAVCRSLKLAGNQMDDEIVKYIRQRYQMLIGKRTAEEAKKAIGCIYPGKEKKSCTIKGRSLVTGMPVTAELSSEEIAVPMKEVATSVVLHIRDILEETSPELLGDIYSDGLVLTGGTANAEGFGQLIKETVGLRVRIPEQPELCVIKGCGSCLKFIDRPHNTEMGIDPISDRY